MTKRNDIHSPSKMVVQDYSHIHDYSDGFMFHGEECDGVGLTELADIREEQSDNFVDIHPTDWVCDCCGSQFKHGSLFKHNKSGDILNIGHICAKRLGLISNHKVWNDLKKLSILKSKKLAHRRSVRKEMHKTLKENPDLSDLLKTNHRIVVDIRNRFIEWGKVSENQIELLKKIKVQVAEDPINWISVPEEVLSGKASVIGTIKSVKFVENAYSWYDSDIPKGFIVVETPEGCWKTWGTLTERLLEKSDVQQFSELVGTKFQFTATFSQAKDDDSMSFFKRPSKISVLSTSVDNVSNKE